MLKIFRLLETLPGQRTINLSLLLWLIIIAELIALGALTWFIFHT